MSTTKTITLLTGSRDAVVDNTRNQCTTIHYKNPAWPTKTGIYRIPGRWKIQSSRANKITLVPDPDLKPFEMPINH